MKLIAKNLFDAADAALINSDVQAGWGFDNVIESSPVLEIISGSGPDVNVLHILNMLDAHGFQGSFAVEEAAQVEPGSALVDAQVVAADESPELAAAPADVVEADNGGARLAFAGAGSGMCLPYKEIDSVGDPVGDTFEFNFSEVFGDQPFVDDTGGNFTDVGIEAPQILVCEGYAALEDVELKGEPEVIFTKESQDTEFNAIEIDVSVDVVLTEDAPVEDVSTGDETVDVSVDEPAIETFEPAICIGMPMVIDLFVWTDDGTFEFDFPEVLLFEPAIDGVEANGIDTLLPELMTCGGDPMPEIIFSTEFVDAEFSAAEITLTGVAEGHPA